MKPIKETKTITVYKCADCSKEHGLPANAETCCACCACQGPTNAEDKKIAHGGSTSYYRSDLLCTWCRIRRDVKTQQDHVRRCEAKLQAAKRALEHVEQELKRYQAELEALTTTRDTLPSKPRQPKPKEAVT